MLVFALIAPATGFQGTALKLKTRTESIHLANDQRLPTAGSVPSSTSIEAHAEGFLKT
jgi:hypothetical protein